MQSTGYPALGHITVYIVSFASLCAQMVSVVCLYILNSKAVNCCSSLLVSTWEIIAILVYNAIVNTLFYHDAMMLKLYEMHIIYSIIHTIHIINFYLLLHFL